jgi:hypothetical protein
MSTQRNGHHEAVIDLSGLFTDMRDALQSMAKMLHAIGTAVVKISSRDDFTLFCNGAEMPLQKARNGRVRSIYNPTANAITVQLMDMAETPLLGYPTPFALAAGAVQLLWLPFKNGLRATSTGMVVVTGHVTTI